MTSYGSPAPHSSIPSSGDAGSLRRWAGAARAPMRALPSNIGSGRKEMAMEPHVCKISQTGTDWRGEWVSVVNSGLTPVALTGLELTDYTKTQQHVHIYRFPATTSGGAL